MIDRDIIYDRPFELLGKDRYDDAIMYAQRAEYNLSYVDDDDIWLKALAFLFSASDGLEKRHPYYYVHDANSISIAKIALRLYVLIKPDKDPYVQTCRFLQIAALSNITEDYDFINKWMHERKVLQTIPKGHYNDKTLHFFYQLSHHTINYFLNKNTAYLSCVDTLYRQIINSVNDFARFHKDTYLIIYLMGLGIWCRLLSCMRKAIDVDTTIQFIKDITKILENDVYLFPSWLWTRSSFAKNLQSAAMA